MSKRVSDWLEAVQAKHGVAFTRLVAHISAGYHMFTEEEITQLTGYALSMSEKTLSTLLDELELTVDTLPQVEGMGAKTEDKAP